MAEFDPYHKWLGIRPEEQPPNYYRLLGILRFESDADVIEAAVDRQMGYIQQMANGPHGAMSQRILNELAAARICLLNPGKKAAYDHHLKAQSAKSTRMDDVPKVTRPSAGSVQTVPQSTEEVVPNRDLASVPSRRNSFATSNSLAHRARQLFEGNVDRKFLLFATMILSGFVFLMMGRFVVQWVTSSSRDEPVVAVHEEFADFSPATNGTGVPIQASPSSNVTSPSASSPAPAARAAPPLAVAPFLETEAKQHQQAWADHLGVKLVRTNSIGMDLVLIPPGKFRMGSPASDSEASDNEKPQVEVTLTKPLFVGQTEVTQGQWKSVMGTEPWKEHGNPDYYKSGSQYAASYVSHEDAVEFCKKLSAREGKTYRLFTAAEWEYACRAGTTTKYHFGDSDGSLGKYAWFYENAYDIGEQYAHEVGKKEPNPFGLYDMHGNVWEWCQDWFHFDIYQTRGARQTDPVNLKKGSVRVFRGGSWNFDARFCQSAYFAAERPGIRRISLGFRVAQVVSAQDSSTLSNGSTPVPPRTSPAPVSIVASPQLFDFATQQRSAVEAKASQEVWAKHLGKEVVKSNTVGMKLVLIPPGKFKMGSPRSPVEVEVTLTQPLYVGQTEVTQGQCKAVMGTEPWKEHGYPNFYKSGSQYAASYVSHEDAVEFCKKLSAREGKTYRLLTEAEWVYACRAGTTTKYHFGDSDGSLGKYAWFYENAYDIGEQYAHEVGKKEPNPFGLYDMHGNVCEWCQDWQHSDFPETGGARQTDPVNLKKGSNRVFKGGSRSSPAKFCQPTARGRYAPSYRGGDLGFRVAQVPSGQ